MDVAVLTLTRDRLDYTRHCFASLHEHAGVPFDHLVLDQGSSDGTGHWLEHDYMPDLLIREPENIGISRGMNRLLEFATECDHDVIVKLDNDCELTEPNTLRDVCAAALAGDCLLSPRIAGLNNPPYSIGEFTVGGETVIDVPQIGGVFLAAPAWVYRQFRYDDSAPTWGLDDVSICAWFRSRGGRCGYLKRLTANHYETTGGQHARHPAYFQRTLAEGKPAL